MRNFVLILFFFFHLFFNIKCYFIPCSKATDGKPSSPFHCSGLNITEPGDSHCCLWKFYDKQNNKNMTRCSSIREDQYQNLHGYILNRTSKYPNLDIQCSGDQTLYCSNILFDQEHIDNCQKLPISDAKDRYCCRWSFKDNTNNGKSNYYCASITDYQYITINDYLDYKEKHGNGRYDDLSIDCEDFFINLSSSLYILLFIFLTI